MRHEEVQEYYGKVLQGTGDLQTNACCTADAVPDRLKPVLAGIHDEVTARYYGCGLIHPERIEGCRILDLGCGSGRDVYALARLVGPEGSVVGVDMTAEQLDVARAHEGWHAERYGYAAPNTSFLEGNIERLDALPLEPGSFDVIVSNCVVNLAEDKAAVFRGAARLLKPGGEMYFSDVYSDRRMPEDLMNDPVLWGECLSGALYWRDFETAAMSAGFAAPRLVTDRPFEVGNPGLAAKLGAVRFFSATYRLFRVDGLDAGEEDYGATATYSGGLPEAEEAFVLAKDAVFPVGTAVAVSSNTARLLAESRFADVFSIDKGDGVHRGPFVGAVPFDIAQPATKGCCG